MSHSGLISQRLEKRIPSVVGTISTWEYLGALPSDLTQRCDIVEVRADLLQLHEKKDELSANSSAQSISDEHRERILSACATIEKIGVPVLLTLRSHDEGGQWKGLASEREAFYKKALACVSMVDVELRNAQGAGLLNLVQSVQKHLIVSFHDFEGTPTLSVLRDTVRRAEPLASLVKIVTTVSTGADSEVLLSLLSEKHTKPICVIGMGPLGVATRVEFPAIGSLLTYGYLDEIAAPGQLSALDLVQKLSERLETYRTSRE